jgi:hypothetical protein
MPATRSPHATLKFARTAYRFNALPTAMYPADPPVQQGNRELERLRIENDDYWAGGLLCSQSVDASEYPR